MINPYASPASDCSQHTTDQGILPVRWTRPTFGTFGYLALHWGCSLGILGGTVVFVQSLFGVKTDVTFMFWRFQGIVAGLVGIPIASLGGTLFGLLPATLYPVLRLGIAASTGPRLRFRTEGDQNLAFAQLQVRSYIVLSALLGVLTSLFGIIVLLIVVAAGIANSYGFHGVPLLFDGMARLIWIVLAAPLLYALYGALLGIFTYLPFRLLARLTGAAIPSREILASG